jgi:hypothetical protein
MDYALDYLPGIVSDDTVLARGGRFVDGSHVRWVKPDGGQKHRPQLCGGWERLIRQNLGGVCRSTFAWVDNAARLNIAFGTNTGLYIWRGGELFDITPYGPPTRLGANPLTSVNASGTVTVSHTAHGFTTGAQVKVYGAVTFNGLDAANLNGVRTITVINADSYSFTAGASDTASASGAGGGSDVIVVPQTALPAGQVNGTGTSGYGAGGYGVGGYSQPSEEEYFPRSWSFGTLGEALVASPRDGAIYLWENDSSARAEWIQSSPIRCGSILTTPERVIMALGVEEEVSKTYNARAIRHCDSRVVVGTTPGYEVWYTDSDTLARERVLEGAGRIVAGRNVGSNIFIWTDNELFEAAYVGALDELYAFIKRGEDCGLVGPLAACVRNQRAYWLTPDLQFMVGALGTEPQPLDCPHRAELRNYLAPSQRDKIVASTLSAFGEAWFFYPDTRDGLENSRALFFHMTDGWWSKDQIARTSFIDAGPADYPLGVDADGRIFWHERGKSADGGRISWRLRAGPQYIDATRIALLMRAFRPDFQDQEGAINITLYTREAAQADDVADGPYVMEADTESIPLHVEGRIISWEISGEAAPVYWRMGIPIVEGRTTRRAK